MSRISESEDWLALLLWGLDILARPSPANILRGFEAWDYEQRLRPQLRNLERAKLLERRGPGQNYTCHLTPQGRLTACGGVDPPERWRRSWDGKWRLLLFDLPSHDTQVRQRLWRWLRSQRFGYLQHSVWISPDPISEEELPLKHLKLTPESFTVIEGRPTAPDSDADIVRSAWDLATINRRHQSVLNLGRRGLDLAKRAEPKPAELRQWLADDREQWLIAINSDPLLPDALLPNSYLGREAWKLRHSAYLALFRHGIK